MPEEPLYVWATNRTLNPNACQAYRINTPLRQLEKMGLALCFEETADCDQKDGTQAMLSSDVDLFYNLGGETPLHQITVINDLKPGTRGDGQIHYPPVTVYDADDNTDFVHPMNQTFSYLGVRTYPDAHLLSPGQTLEWENYKGIRQTLWEDKVTTGNGFTFDIERNLYQMKIRHRIIRSCHGATASTPALASYFREVVGQPLVHVFPNTVVPEEYEHFKVVRKDPTRVRILWQGSMSHLVDWYPLRDALQEINKIHKDKITWVIYGEWFDWVHDTIPDDMVEYHPWSHYQSYKLRRGLLNIDINLCPLVDNAFNRCKSAIKWYEGSIWDEPEVTLAQNTEPYQEIKDGKTGFLFKDATEFVQKIGILIDNAELRKTVAAESKKWVLTNRIPEKTIPELYAFYQDLKDRQRAKLTPRIIVARR